MSLIGLPQRLLPSEFCREAAPRILKACLVLLRSPKLQLLGTLLGLSSRLGSMLGDRRKAWPPPMLPGTPEPPPGLGPTDGVTAGLEGGSARDKDSRSQRTGHTRIWTVDSAEHWLIILVVIWLFPGPGFDTHLSAEESLSLWFLNSGETRRPSLWGWPSDCWDQGHKDRREERFQGFWIMHSTYKHLREGPDHPFLQSFLFEVHKS